MSLLLIRIAGFTERHSSEKTDPILPIPLFHLFYLPPEPLFPPPLFERRAATQDLVNTHFGRIVSNTETQSRSFALIPALIPLVGSPYFFFLPFNGSTQVDQPISDACFPHRKPEAQSFLFLTFSRPT